MEREREQLAQADQAPDSAFQIGREAQASNLQACGGCDMRLAQRIGAELASYALIHG
jgi:hypothetical protein